MGIQELVDRYFNQIEVAYTDYAIINDAKSDAATITLEVPFTMIKEYQRLKGSRKRLPDGAEFWRETGLLARLKNSDKVPRRAYSNTTLGDVLDYLGGKCWVNFTRMSKDKVELSLTEVPDFYED
jgi:hypothetical protein